MRDKTIFLTPAQIASAPACFEVHSRGVIVRIPLKLYLVVLYTALCSDIACAQDTTGIRLAGRVELSRLADYIAATCEITVVYDPVKQ